MPSICELPQGSAPGEFARVFMFAQCGQAAVAAVSTWRGAAPLDTPGCCSHSPAPSSFSGSLPSSPFFVESQPTQSE